VQGLLESPILIEIAHVVPFDKADRNVVGDDGRVEVMLRACVLQVWPGQILLITRDVLRKEGDGWRRENRVAVKAAQVGL
jgi:hypothetical protein